MYIAGQGSPFPPPPAAQAPANGPVSRQPGARGGASEAFTLKTFPLSASSSPAFLSLAHAGHKQAGRLPEGAGSLFG